MPIDTVFYDGTCGFCHRSVKLLLAADRRGELFRFAPLFGATFRARVPAADQARLPDSLVVLTADHRLLMRSDGVLYLLRRLGGCWRVPALLLAVLPRPIRDWLYDCVAAIRYKLFRRPTTACPLLPPDLRRRFDP